MKNLKITPHMHKPFLLTIFCFMFALGAGAQEEKRYNFGLAEPQPDSMQPRSRVAVEMPVRKPKIDIPGGFTVVSERELILSHGWEMADADQVTGAATSIFDQTFDTRSWFNATIPGTVLTTLVDRGVYPDPYWGLNNMAIPDTLCRTEWWYRNSFELPPADQDARLTLVFNGINYFADVWLNGRKLGTIRGAFRRGIFDVTDVMRRKGKNVLAVKIIPPNNPGIPQNANGFSHGSNGGVLCLDGPTFISSEGWDWVPGVRDRNIGIWQDVRLEIGSGVTVADPQVITDLLLPDISSAFLTVKTTLKNDAGRDLKATLHFGLDGRTIASHPVTLAVGEHKKIALSPAELPGLKINAPRLWWPNGYGDPHLYCMTLSLTGEKGDTLDFRRVRFGVRQLEYELMAWNENGNVRINFNPQHSRGLVFDNNKRRSYADRLMIPYLAVAPGNNGVTQIDDPDMGAHLVVKVNGRRIFCRGGNWGMDDMMKRVERERLEPFFKLHRELGFAMIRNWTGESTQESFYDLCDEYGMLVFNDFWISTGDYNLNPADNRLFMENVRETIIRQRNHPSIALWCPRNEGFAPELLESQIAEAVASLDGTRHYIANSRYMNAAGSGPWQYREPSFYDGFASGFRTEIGGPALPTAESIRKMMAPEDVWPIGDGWYYHDWLMGQWGNSGPFMIGFMRALDSKFGVTEDFERYVWRAQLLQYECYRAIFESWNSRMWNDASGVLLWMSHPAWNSLIWQTYSRDCETPGTYFGTKKACTPLHVQLNQENMEINVINTTPDTRPGLEVLAVIYDTKGKKLSSQLFRADASVDRATPVGQLKTDASFPELVLVTLYLRDGRGKLIDENTYWIPRNLKKVDLRSLEQIPQANLTVGKPAVKRTAAGIEGKIVITNRSDHIALMIKPGLLDSSGRERVLPTFFSDGYFTLMPGEAKELAFSVDSQNIPGEMILYTEAFNVPLREMCRIK